MEIHVLNSKAENKAWKYLPHVKVLSLYLKHNELIQLSNVCKNYRTQLKSLVFRKLIVGDIRSIVPNFDFEHPENYNVFKSIISELKIDFRGYYNIVKEVEFIIGFSNEFARDFFMLFPKISKIIITKPKGEYSLKNLIKILYNHDYLQHINLNCNFVNFKPKNIHLNYEFFYRLKTIILEVPSEAIHNELPFDVIDSSFSNMKYLSVINSHMLNNISNGLGSLVHIELSSEYIFEEWVLIKFIDNSCKLKKLSISTKQMSQAVIDSILRSKAIEHLIIRLYHNFSNIELNTLTKNYSIKILTIERSNYKFNPIKILEACQSIEALELLNFFDTSFWQKHWNSYTGKLSTIIFNSLHHSAVLSSVIPNITNANEIKFIDGCKFLKFFKYYKLSNCHNWVPKQDYSNDTDEFTLIKNFS
ncbi:hypothetical protein CONCODRAFT_13525 [Conidiobolus coronatus NRRL 28638]|uniref:F-box domain-containing protein n=1 Tax=Conidiobolus coronatus (strain ATCC 28846 / CBS 209.66 / NRRL 28638) TaxID=796925 RepID=A0A137NQJ4_CONC2|nr:hypothetical protein CONCODRAFT_13525 [Conidiobolus coronatus NRRL 28638]|eukprot:KXN65033.1 hypothetical protein CONCODRAFT_13525 [Conidiobolus coronatus NRRL 28638]